MIGEELVFFSFLYIKLFELGVKVAFKHRSAVTHHKVNLLEFPLWTSSFERTDDAFVLLIWSPAPETISEERPWIEVVPCLLTFFDRYCHLYILCLLCQLFLAADS